MTGGSLVLGLLNGITLGLLAVGVVLVYRSNRFLNLAHAEMGVISAQVLAKLVLDYGWDWWAAFAVSVPIAVAIGLLIERFAIRPLRERRASPVTLLLVTIGINQLLIGLSLVQAFGASPTRLLTHGYPLPFHAAVAVGGVELNGADVLAAVVVPLLIIGLAAFLRLTVLGKSIRAAASNPDAARLSGVSIRKVSMVVWALAGGLSALAAILQAPSQSTFEAATLGPDLLFLALGAAALAAFTSISLAMVGGVAIGLADQLTFAASKSASEAELVVFLLVVAIVLIRGRAIGRVFAVSGAALDGRPPLQLTDRALRVGWIRERNRVFPPVALALALMAPLLPIWTSSSHRFELSLIAIYALGALSLTVALGWTGQISLGQFAFLGAGAFLSARLLQHYWSLPLVVIVAGLLGAVLMTMVGIPALRVPGLTLAVTTLGFAIIGPDWLFQQSWFGSNQASGVTLTPPMLARGLGRPSSYLVVYYIGVVLVAVAAAGLVTLRRTQAGRALLAVRDNAPAAASFGLTPAAVKVAGMALSGFIAAGAGALWADSWRYVSTSQFTPDLSLALMALPVIGGIGSIGGTVAAAVLFEGATLFVAPHLGSLFGSAGGIGFQLMLAGGGLTLAVLKAPGGLAAVARDWLQRRIDRLDDQPAGEWTRPERPSLVVEDVHLRFGGIRALNGASIGVHPGEIVGLIGPNGAGKTTLLNVISGNLAAGSGRVLLGELDVTDLPPEMRSSFGLSRSFQDARLFPGLTVLEAIQLAVAKERRASLLSSASGAPWVRAAERDYRRQAEAVVARFGLGPWAGKLTSDLSTGTRRICDLAAQVAARPSVLLLDEPTAGVAQREAEAFGPLLRRIRDELGCSILIVEHDMPLLMGLCDRVYAMVDGQVVASGSPDEVRSDPMVIAAYLGSSEVAVSRSGRGAPVARTTKRTPAAKRTPAQKRAPAQKQAPAQKRAPAEKRAPVRARTRLDPAGGEG